MTSLFVKGLLLKSTADEEYSSTNLKQRRRCENGVLRVLDHHLQRPFLQWIRHGNLSIARRTESRIGGAVPLRAVLNPVSPPVMTTKKVCMNYALIIVSEFANLKCLNACLWLLLVFMGLILWDHNFEIYHVELNRHVERSYVSSVIAPNWKYRVHLLETVL